MHEAQPRQGCSHGCHPATHALSFRHPHTLDRAVQKRVRALGLALHMHDHRLRRSSIVAPLPHTHPRRAPQVQSRARLAANSTGAGQAAGNAAARPAAAAAARLAAAGAAAAAALGVLL